MVEVDAVFVVVVIIGFLQRIGFIIISGGRDGEADGEGDSEADGLALAE